MTDTFAEVDPFQTAESLPSLSFKDSKAGSFEYTLTITGAPSLRQSKDFDTDEPAVWPDGNPKMAAVVPVRVTAGPRDVGTERAIWAVKGSSLFSALADAQKNAGAKFATGGTLTLSHADDKAPKNPKHNKVKVYAASYVAPDAFGTDEAPF